MSREELGRGSEFNNYQSQPTRVGQGLILSPRAKKRRNEERRRRNACVEALITRACSLANDELSNEMGLACGKRKIFKGFFKAV